MVAFDTSVVDLTDELGDPVDVLFGIQLGGGTDIDQALGYCQTLVAHPAKTVLVLITDLFEGGDPDSMLRRAASLLRSGVRLIVLLALVRRRRARLRPRARGRASPRSARPSSPARPTGSRTCWPRRSRAATSGLGRATSS